MKKLLIIIALLAIIGGVLSCTKPYKTIIEEQVETDSVTPITLDEATEIQSNEPVVVTFVISGLGMSVDKVVNIGDFCKGGEADVVYMIRNECDYPITPIIYYRKWTHVDDYSKVDGQGFVDAPDYVEQWISITPSVTEIPPQSAQGYIVALIMPEDAPDFPQKWAFQVGVGIGEKVRISTCAWWLVCMKK